MLSGWLFWMLAAFVTWRLVGRCGSRGRPERTRLEPREDERKYVDALESRVSELEERLDFTERLLAARGWAI
jgi:hypothetical protein